MMSFETMSVVNTLLVILTITGVTLVPETVVPTMVWPLILGLGNLTLVLMHLVQHRALLDEDLAPLLTAVFSCTLAIAIPIEQVRHGLAFLIAFVVTLLAGVIWSAWRAARKSEPWDNRKP